MAAKQPLSAIFVPSQYRLKASSSGKNFHLIINGQRQGRPSKRLTLHQSSLKIHSAEIIRTHREKVTDLTTVRINHLPSRQEVRIHTAQLQYPGLYTVKLIFSGTLLKDLHSLDIEAAKSSGLRKYLPSIDEPPVLEKVVFDVDA